MKKFKKLLVFIVAISTVLLLTACGARTCHYCDEVIEGDPVEAGGRYYCSYDHYMNELWLG